MKIVVTAELGGSAIGDKFESENALELMADVAAHVAARTRLDFDAILNGVTLRIEIEKVEEEDEEEDDDDTADEG